MVKIHKPRAVPEYKLFTVSGKPVYQRGPRGHTLDKTWNGQMQHFTIDPVDCEWSQKRLLKAATDTGEPCEWRFHRNCEVVGVSF